MLSKLPQWSSPIWLIASQVTIFSVCAFICLCVNFSVYNVNCRFSNAFFLHSVNQSTTPNLLDHLHLTPADRDDVTDVTRRHAGVAHALSVWKKVNPSRVTFRALVEIAIGLRIGDTATDICTFIVENTSGINRPKMITVLCL